MYYQHLPLVEFDGDDENAVLVKYVWGPDPSPERRGGATRAYVGNVTVSWKLL